MTRLLYFLVIYPVLLLSESITISLNEHGSIQYVFEEDLLIEVQRMSSAKKVLYTHEYIYDSQGNLVSEELIGGLGRIEYLDGNVTKSPFSIEKCNYDNNGNLTTHCLDGVDTLYSYNAKNELITNRIEVPHQYNDEGLLVQKYDHTFHYDGETLIKANSNTIHAMYEYDTDGKRISKTVNGEKETYLYMGNWEIGILDEDNRLKALRIPGLSFHKDLVKPIAIETCDKIYAPIHDVQGNIIKLIDISTEEVITYEMDPFGTNLPDKPLIPWIFAGKHVDSETGLVYFGSRYYAPDLREWITPDPLFQSDNTHLYCLNNPLTYCDPDGNWAIVLPIAQGLCWSSIAAATAAALIAEYAAHKIQDWWNGPKDDELYDIIQTEEFLRHSEYLTETGGISLRDSFPSKLDRSKKGTIDESLPNDIRALEDDPGWEEISHKDALKNGRRTFKDKRTQEILDYDIGKLGEYGHKAHPHFHRRNPKTTSKRDLYLDVYGNPVPKNSEESHLYPPEWKWW